VRSCKEKRVSHNLADSLRAFLCFLWLFLPIPAFSANELLRLPLLVPSDGAEGEEQDRREDQQCEVRHAGWLIEEGRDAGESVAAYLSGPRRPAEAKPAAEPLRAVPGVPTAASLIGTEAAFATSIGHD
jgi:hypothetical protein